ncbi:hypothetical protein GOBAR_AA31575 [Gossypium barbadense]|uniref:Uncharacterized protein n=1 Tax=Gossypium barbadense TaxID=3634 RepID=A0A2P5WDG0_GOSBA|nr:hypothetical protein GOBAR_AA31575 [Gossypium barbadense]
MAPDHQIRRQRQRRRNRLVVLQEGRERKSLDILERKGAVAPSEPYTCGVCGLKCKRNLDFCYGVYRSV